MQYNVQRKKDKMINNVLQNKTQKTQDLVTQTPLNTKGEVKCSGGEVVPVNILTKKRKKHDLGHYHGED
jgi:hypothetical protein